MFSGIIEQVVTLVDTQQEGTNLHLTFKCDITNELKVDQSIAHNGVCLTVTDIDGDRYSVTAIEETLRLTNLGKLHIDDIVNFERCIRLNDRLDGHMVQGHVDGIATVRSITERDGSWNYELELDGSFTTIDGYDPERLIVHKGSITINGTSLTVTFIDGRRFGVSIIPYTYDHTIFHRIKVGDTVNIELDVLGKYVARLMSKA